MKSNRLTYKKFSPEDFEDYYKLISNYEVVKYISGVVISDLAEAKEKFERVLSTNEQEADLGLFKVCQIADRQFVGLAKLSPYETTDVELGYSLLPEFWGKGYGTEICAQMLELGLSFQSFKNIIAIIDPKNPASRKILEKNNFIQYDEGELDGLQAAFLKYQK